MATRLTAALENDLEGGPRAETVWFSVGGASVRAWAEDQGIKVSTRGRIPASVVEQYEAATRAH